MKIKNLILSLIKKIKDFYGKYSITIIIILISTILISIFESLNTDITEKILILSLTSCAGTFLIEIFLNKKVIKFIGYAVALAMGIFFTFIIKCEERVIIGYILTIFLISIYGIIKKEKVLFKDYIAKSFANIFTVSIIYSIVNIGIILLIVVFTELIIDCGFGNIFIKTEIIILGMFYIPAILYSITNLKNKEINGFIKGLLKFVLFPLVLTGIAIIYLYIAKIIILRNMPSNIIFRILSIMFIFAFTIWNMVRSIGKNSKFLDKTTKILPYLYMPFIVLEGISLGLRIYEYGITPIRCIGLACMIIQIMALIYNIIKDGEKLERICIYMAIIVFILLVTPLNYDQISLYSQKNILIKYLKDDINTSEISNEDKHKIVGAYNYIISNFGKEGLPKNINEDKLINIIETNWDDVYYDNYSYDSKNIFFCRELQNIDISKYSKISATNIYKGLSYGQSDETMDLTEFIYNVIEIDNKSQNVEEYIEDNKIQEIDENVDFIITSLSISYSEQNKGIQYYAIDGYILEK